MNQGATGNWYSAANPTSSAGIDNFSATCYYTALHLKLSVPAFKDVPLGLVRSSVGGQVCLSLCVCVRGLAVSSSMCEDCCAWALGRGEGMCLLFF